MPEKNPQHNPHQDRRDVKGRYRYTLESANRDARAAELHAQGWTYREIGEELGMDKSNAVRSVRNAVRKTLMGPAEEVIRIHTSRLEYAFEKMVEIMEADHVVVSHGKIICDEYGTPLRDHAPVIAATREARQLLESFRRMMGIDQPIKVEAQVTELTQQDIELQEMVAEIRAKNAATASALRTQREQGA